MKVWRIATENKKYLATDLSGEGASKSPGRWNSLDVPVLYTADSPALAMLETISHIDANGLPQQKYLISIEIETTSWKQRFAPTINNLPKDWDAIPSLPSSAIFGSNWLTSNKNLVMCIPSAITPENIVILLNPKHPDASKLKVQKIRTVDYKTVFR